MPDGVALPLGNRVWRATWKRVIWWFILTLLASSGSECSFCIQNEAKLAAPLKFGNGLNSFSSN